MANAVLSGVRFAVDHTTGLPFVEGGVVYYATGEGQPARESTFRTELTGSETLNQLADKVRAAVDAEAVRLGVDAPAAVLSPAMQKLR